jgi:hypothetical protein
VEGHGEMLSALVDSFSESRKNVLMSSSKSEYLFDIYQIQYLYEP